MIHVTCRLTAKNRDQLGTLRSAIEHWLPFFYLLPHRVCETKVSSMAHAARLPRSIAAVGVTLYTLGFKSACSRPENGDLGGIWPPWPWTATLTFIFNVGELGSWFVRIQSIKVRGQAVQQSIGNRRTRPIVLPYAADVAGNDLLKMTARHHCQPVGLGLASQTAVFCDVSWVFER